MVMDIDESFRLVFNNVVIRNNIFKSVTEINNKLGYTGIKFNSTTLKWILSSKNYQLLLYKLKINYQNIRNQFIDNNNDSFYSFLRNNYDIDILKEIISIIYPNLLLNQQDYQNEESNNEKIKLKIIENCSLLTVNNFYGQRSLNNINKNKNNNDELILNIIKYLINELNIKPNLNSIENLKSKFNLRCLKYIIKNGYYRPSKTQKDYGLIYSIILNADFELFKFILLKRSINWSICKEYKTLEYIVLSSDYRFLKYCLEREGEEKQVVSISKFQKESQIYNLNKFIVRNGTLEMMNYISTNEIYKDSLLSGYGLPVIMLSVAGRKDLNILKFFLEKIKKVNISIFENLMEEYCKLGDLECCLYLSNEKNIDLKNNSRFLDSALTSYHFFGNNNNNPVSEWLLSISNCGCSIKTLQYCISNIKTHKQYVDIILNKFRSNFTNDDILLFVLSISSIYENFDNFKYLSSFLPIEMVPSFPITKFVEYEDCWFNQKIKK